MKRLPDERTALLILRLIVPVFLLVHGASRALEGSVPDFGQFLDSRGLHPGTAIAWVLTVMEIAGSLLLMAGCLVRIFAVLFIMELAAGIIMVHFANGWFVVGGGTNGTEYSVLPDSLLQRAVHWPYAPGI